MNLTAIEMLDFHATPAEFEKGGSIVMAINIASLLDWDYNLIKIFFQNSVTYYANFKKFPAGKFAFSP